MSQKFRLAAPRARLAIFGRCKVDRLLFGGSEGMLVRLLAVPVRPQSPPSTSIPAQAQNGRCSTQTASGDSVQETRMDGQAKCKANGEMLAGSLQHYQQAKTQGGHNTLSFSHLPPEIHRLIFDHIDYIEDIICLGLTGRYFWTFARDYMHTYYMSFLGRWAGENIVCVGEYVNPDDYPPGLFSAEERDGLHQKEIDVRVDTDDFGLVWCKKPITLYRFALPTISKLESFVDLRKISSDLFSLCRDRSEHEDPAFQATRSEILVTESNYFPQDHPWILRNLTTREFIRSEAIALKPRYICGPNIHILGFGEVVISRICCSSSSSVGMKDPTNISRGVWAGHRFDITTLVRHEDETNGAGWSDVSNEVMRDIADIWESEYGTDWRDKALIPVSATTE